MHWMLPAPVCCSNSGGGALVFGSIPRLTPPDDAAPGNDKDAPPPSEDERGASGRTGVASAVGVKLNYRWVIRQVVATTASSGIADMSAGPDVELIVTVTPPASSAHI